MPEVFDWPGIDRLPNPVRCPWCGSKYTSMARGPQRRYYCHSCFRSFETPAEVAYDVIAEEWTPALAALQAAGELIAVRLGAGFYGICLLGEVSELETALRPTQIGPSPDGPAPCPRRR